MESTPGAAIPPSALIELLGKCFQEEILNCCMSAGCNPGDNVVGKMLSVKAITASGDKHDLVVKSAVPFRSEGKAALAHEEKLFARLIAAFGSFQVELVYYQQIKPGLKAITSRDLSLPTPKLYFGQNDNENGGLNACLILEDLRFKGYKMADKMRGLNIDEVIMVLEKIASFHAASYVYLQQNQINTKEKLDPLSVHIFESTDSFGAAEMHRNFSHSLLNDMYELGKESKTISKELYSKILKWTHDPRDLILKSSKQATKEYFPVITHGDLWVNNMMFKYDYHGKPVDICFIDFQQCRYSSIFDELHYFIYTSTTVAFRKQYLDTCLKFYHETLHETLKSLQISKEDKVVSKFTLDEFLEGYRKFMGAAFCYAVYALPFQVGVPTDSVNEDENNIESVSKHIQGREFHDTSNSKQSGYDELLKFTASTFNEMRAGLRVAATNSPVLIQRFGELCVEMDEMGIFD